MTEEYQCLTGKKVTCKIREELQINAEKLDLLTHGNDKYPIKLDLIIRTCPNCT